jgi:hypothetical protein
VINLLKDEALSLASHGSKTGDAATARAGCVLASAAAVSVAAAMTPVGTAGNLPSMTAESFLPGANPH